MVTRAEPAAKAANKELVFTRVIDAPRELVFEAWTTCEHMKEWYGPTGFTVSMCEMDARPGGSMRVTMRSPDGTEYPGRGVYEEFAPPGSLVVRSFALGEGDRVLIETLNAVTFAAEGGKTRLTLRVRVVKAADDAAPYLDGMDEGWNQTLDRMVERAEEVRRGRELVLTRVLDAPRSLVWEATSKCEHIKRWWGPRGYTVPICEIDFRPGGAWRFVQHDPKGNEHPFKGVYLEVVAPERVVHTFIYDVPMIRDSVAVVTVTLEEQGGKTKLTSRTVFPTPEAYEGAVASGMEPGAKETLDRLAELVVALKKRA